MGKIKRNKRRDKTGRFTNNDISWQIIGDVAFCYSNGKALFFTDSFNVALFKGFTISKLADGYSCVYRNGERISVHRFLSCPRPDEVVDHINQNKMDNRLCNLRNTNKSVNSFNSKMHSNNRSGVRGVHFRKDTNRWSAEIKVNGKKIMLGCYGTKEEAAQARKEGERKYNVYQ